MIGTNYLRIGRRIKKQEAGNAPCSLRPKTEPFTQLRLPKHGMQGHQRNMGLDQQSYMHCKTWQRSGGKMCNMTASQTQKGRQAGTNDCR